MHGLGGAGDKYFQATRSCDYCQSAAALLFCKADSAFLCIACDSKVHSSHTSHERVWMCEVCEQAAAVVSCKADAAVLCSDCDRDIHSANPLARRHDRTPVVPFYENAESVVLNSAAEPLVPIHSSTSSSGVVQQADLLTNASSWIPTKLPAQGQEIKSIEFLFSDSDQLLDFEISQQISSQFLSDCVVPVQTTTKQPVPALPAKHYSSENRFEIDFTTSNLNSYNNSYTTSSLGHSISSSSMDLCVVPDGSALSDISYPFCSIVNSVVDLSGNQGFPASGLDREARVLRYREKRKNRRFQKTIRYASRKAYAETRPRIKGRFAKRSSNVELEGDPVFLPGSPDHHVFDARYDIVMSF